MRAGAKERRKAAPRDPGAARAAGEADVRAAIAELSADDQLLATRIHDLVLAAAPDLVPRTFYGSPAYARDGKVICFFQASSKYKVRYATLGFQPDAHLDEGEMWPTSFAITALTPEVEERIKALVRKAAG